MRLKSASSEVVCQEPSVFGDNRGDFTCFTVKCSCSANMSSSYSCYFMCWATFSQLKMSKALLISLYYTIVWGSWICYFRHFTIVRIMIVNSREHILKFRILLQIYMRVGILILIQHTYRVHIFTDPRCTPQSYVEHVSSDEGVAWCLWQPLCCWWSGRSGLQRKAWTQLATVLYGNAAVPQVSSSPR